MKFYTSTKSSSQSMPLGFYIGTYTDHMVGFRNVITNNNYSNTNEQRVGCYQSIGFNFGFTFYEDKFTIEPNLGIGLSYVSKSLLNKGDFLNFDPIVQTYSTCHLQLNLGYRF